MRSDPAMSRIKYCSVLYQNRTKIQQLSFCFKVQIYRMVNLVVNKLFYTFLHNPQKQLKSHGVHCKTNCVLFTKFFIFHRYIKIKQSIVNPNSTHNTCV